MFFLKILRPPFVVRLSLVYLKDLDPHVLRHICLYPLALPKNMTSDRGTVIILLHLQHHAVRILPPLQLPTEGVPPATDPLLWHPRLELLIINLARVLRSTAGMIEIHPFHTARTPVPGVWEVHDEVLEVGMFHQLQRK